MAHVGTGRVPRGRFTRLVNRANEKEVGGDDDLEALLGQELPPKLPDQYEQVTIAPCRAYYGSRPTRQQEEAGFV